jgi:geranylgeranyl diphosphate synthase type II
MNGEERSVTGRLDFEPLGAALPGVGGLSDYLDYSRQLVLDEIRAIVPRDRHDTGGLYQLMLDYPLRYGKSLRPALSIAVCRATGGSLSAVLPTAAVLELYHNAFLIHDDIEDQSYLRRAETTLSRLHGVPTAINVGDGMLALTMQPLLQNIERIGLGKTLKVLRTVARMARESAEGQMLELRWISSGAWDHVDADYVRLVHKKTGWYSFIAPVMAGAIIAGLADRDVERIGWKFIPLGIAFQLQDDILNLVANETAYNKDLWGDLWEGKHTLILIHALRVAHPVERTEALRILRKPHPAAPPGPRCNSKAQILALMDMLVKENALTEGGYAKLARECGDQERTSPQEVKSEADIAYLRELVRHTDSIAYAQLVARRYARHFRHEIGGMLAALPPSHHRDFLADLADFTTHREL